MGRYTPPMRAFALRNADDNTVYLYGTGTYVGDLVPPGSETAPPEMRERIVEFLRQEDSIPVDRSFPVQMIVEQAKRGIESRSKETREQVIARVEAERARPLEVRVQEHWNRMKKNPCIHLDNGDTVWGFQCWWGPEEKLEGQIGERKVEIVPVPKGNARWSTT